MTVLLKNAFHAFHGLFLRWFNTVEFVLFTHCHPFVFAQFVVGEKFDFLNVTHITGKFTEAMR